MAAVASAEAVDAATNVATSVGAVDVTTKDDSAVDGSPAAAAVAHSNDSNGELVVYYMPLLFILVQLTSRVSFILSFSRKPHSLWLGR